MAATPAPPQGLTSPLFASGALGFFLLGILPALFGVALPVWSDAFGLAEGQGGTLVALYNAGAAMAVLAGVAGVPGLSMRPASAVVALGAAGLALGAAWGLLLASAFLAGLGFGVLAVAINRRFLGEFGARGPGMVAFVNGIYGLGAILAPLLFLAGGGRPGPVLWAAAALALLAMALSRPEPFRNATPGLPPLSPRLWVLLLTFSAIVIESSLIGLGASALVDLGTPEPQAARLVWPSSPPSWPRGWAWPSSATGSRPTSSSSQASRASPPACWSRPSSRPPGAMSRRVPSSPSAFRPSSSGRAASSASTPAWAPRPWRQAFWAAPLAPSRSALSWGHSVRRACSGSCRPSEPF